MSRPFHRQTTRLFVQSSLFLAGWLVGPAALIVGAIATMERDVGLLVTAGILALSFGILSLVQLLEGSHTRCAVCNAALFGPSNNHKHREAKTLAGSYKLRMARDVLSKQRYSCPHCNERVVCRESEAQGPRRVKQRATPARALPTMRQAHALPPMRADTLAHSRTTQREHVKQGDDSPTLPA